MDCANLHISATERTKRAAAPARTGLETIAASPPTSPVSPVYSHNSTTRTRQPFGIVDTRRQENSAVTSPQLKPIANKPTHHRDASITKVKGKENTSASFRIKEWEREKQRLKEMQRLQEIERDRDEELKAAAAAKEIEGGKLEEKAIEAEVVVKEEELTPTFSRILGDNYRDNIPGESSKASHR
jgi:serine/threonine-protein kinase GIN4